LACRGPYCFDDATVGPSFDAAGIESDIDEGLIELGAKLN
jgi:hypothetical protein